jgi:hypothetical protein
VAVGDDSSESNGSIVATTDAAPPGPARPRRAVWPTSMAPRAGRPRRVRRWG